MLLYINWKWGISAWNNRRIKYTNTLTLPIGPYPLVHSSPWHTIFWDDLMQLMSSRPKSKNRCLVPFYRYKSIHITKSLSLKIVLACFTCLKFVFHNYLSSLYNHLSSTYDFNVYVNNFINENSYFCYYIIWNQWLVPSRANGTNM